MTEWCDMIRERGRGKVAIGGGHMQERESEKNREDYLIEIKRERNEKMCAGDYKQISRDGEV